MKENEEEIGCGCSCSSCDSCPSATSKEVACDCGDTDCDCNEADGILTFTDEEGKDVEFQVLDTIAVDGKEYLVVLPLDEEEKDEDEQGVVILEIKEEDGEEVYDTVVDEAEGDKVFKLFQKQCDEEDELSEKNKTK